MDSLNSYVQNALEEFKGVTKQPDQFLSVDDGNVKNIKSLLKQSYDNTKQAEAKTIKSQALPELIVDRFDLEQIWQQIELQNDGYLTRSLANVSKLVVGKDKLIFEELKADTESDDGIEDAVEEEDSESDIEEEEDQVEDDEISLNSDDLSGQEELDEQDEEEATEGQPRKKAKKSVVDDDFFKLDEMEAFLQAEEKKMNDKEPDSGNDSESNEDEEVEEEEEDEEDDDLFNGADALENNDTERGQKNNPKYKDFFGDPAESEPKKGRNKFMEEADEMENGEEILNQKSTLEMREERLKKKIEQIEENAVAEKPWQLKGEITADGRPQNSLLEEVVEFDLSTRPAPVITEQTTMVLEDIIRQRIKDKAFDSVEKKEKPSDTPLEYKKKLVLDQEKSKESLAQIYEKEFLAQKEALDPESQDKEEDEPELHKEIKKSMHSLFSKLDALSNFHFTPKQSAPELKIVSNLPAINMEEVAPVAMSDAAMLAPEEVKGKVKGDIIGKGERTGTDKNRERRLKKQKQKKHALEKQKKENNMSKMRPGLGNPYSKEKAKKMLEKITKEKNVDKMDESVGSKSVKSSTAFFTQLQEEVSSQIKGKIKMKKSKTKNEHNARKMKL